MENKTGELMHHVLDAKEQFLLENPGSYVSIGHTEVIITIEDETEHMTHEIFVQLILGDVL